MSDELTSLSRSSTHTIECGYVTVLENRDLPDGPTIALPIAIARTHNPNPQPDPVIYLAGGGGHAHLTYAHFLLESVGNAVLEDRDFVQYNQRGAPGAVPELSCPGYTEFLFSLAADQAVDSIWSSEHDDYIDDCRQNIADSGIDLTQYNSVANAADAADVRIALGYTEANYYGTSYGTRLGLDLIRDHPDGVRSIILDSVYPPDAGYYSEYATTLERSFSAVFSACSADDSCSTRHPDLEAQFYETVDRLNADPVMVSSPFGPVSVDGGVFMDAMAIYLYSPAWIPKSPQAMSLVSDGDLTPVEDVVVGAITSPDLNWNMFYAMQCREEVPFETYEQALVLSADLPSQIEQHYTRGFARFHFEMCESSLSGVADPVEAEPVASDVPALVLAGTFDPATPPGWSRTTAASLENSTYLQYPTLGHGVMRSSECGLSVGLAFIADPTSEPNSSCIDQIPAIDFMAD